METGRSLMQAGTSGRPPAQARLPAQPGPCGGRTARRLGAPAHVCRATVAEKVSEAIEGEDLERWNACVGRVERLGLDREAAEKAVGQAFGWGRQAYWLNKKTNQVPDLEKVEGVLQYLQGELQMSEADLQKALTKFPEVINLSVNGRLKANIAHMQKAYYMKEAQAVATAKRRPEVLGFTIDCEGNCEGLCNQCWVRL